MVDGVVQVFYMFKIFVTDTAIPGKGMFTSQIINCEFVYFSF